ncbi:8347_t:CDS:2 [Funneliformis caledonium]|uniref:8347_t:CDS:1 n=1 Tax=Funneliformis caledonium TaxID=1117310 RepID=A0A9N8YPX3_9GLOM|nr:8347_t:CDS:2 [Funneliformis caledonium]
MLKKYLTCYITLQLLFVINSINSQFIPTKRYEHSATFIDNKLYIMGGLTLSTKVSANTIGKEFFYLDFSASFDNQELTWKDLTNINKVPSHFDGITANGGLKKNTLFLYGGTSNGDNMELVYTFDTQMNSWNVPAITGNVIRKTNLCASVDALGKIYYFGGFSFTDSSDVLDFVILDTINFSWGRGSIKNAIAREDYGSTILPNQNIIYLGGIFNSTLISLKDVHLYDTVNDIWTTKTTSGLVPSDRNSFSAVPGLDGQRVIIFGGLNVKENTESLYVLDLTNFVWSIPTVTGKRPTNRHGHRANVIGKYMVISFGNDYNPEFESDILLLDISNNDEYKWTNFFQNSNDTSPSPIQTIIPAPQKQSDNKIAIIGAISGSLAAICLLSVGAFFLYKWKRNQDQGKVIPTPGDDNYNGQILLIPSDRNI